MSALRSSDAPPLSELALVDQQIRELVSRMTHEKKSPELTRLLVELINRRSLLMRPQRGARVGPKNVSEISVRSGHRELA